MSDLLADFVYRQAELRPSSVALLADTESLTYGDLAREVRSFSKWLVQMGLQPGERVGVLLEKRFEGVVAKFAAAAAGGVFVPLNPILKPRQVGYILRDCNVRVLVTSAARLEALIEVLRGCVDLQFVVLTNGEAKGDATTTSPLLGSVRLEDWPSCLSAGEQCTLSSHRRIDSDMVAIFYTSGSTGMPKGVVLSHRNLVTGARSVSSYLENTSDDCLLAALPLSFDAGFSQLTTAFSVGAKVALLNYLLPRDVVNAVSTHGVTGLTGVPPLFIQLAQVSWPDGSGESLRYIANTGGHLPRATLDRLRQLLPRAKTFLMYGLTEAFRSTYLAPSEVDRRPDSIGKAIPNAEIIVVGSDGRPCKPGEEGELVHRGPLVSLGYWNDRERTAERFRPAPGQFPQLCLPEIAVWSGDIVKMDNDGYLYFVGRRDDMIKTSGNRVSPTEIEEIVYDTGLVAEVAVVGAPHPALGQGIVLFVVPRQGLQVVAKALTEECRNQLPTFMVPHAVVSRSVLPRNANGKIDRASLRSEVARIFAGEPAA